MFARKVSVCLKPNTLSAFIRLMEEELLPWLKTQNGFLDLITLACTDAIEVQVITFWENERSEEAYNEGYPKNVLKSLQALLDGISYGKTFEVVSSTLERIVPARPRELKAHAGAGRSD
jgi:heme-degrading monooxygenase HmoA